MAAPGDKKLVRSKSGLRMVSVIDKFKSPFELEEPPWVPDNQCLQCMECRVRFDLMKRRHHCRRCGKCFCSDCCDNKIPLPRMSFVDPIRLCASCTSVTRKENEFYDKLLKVLWNGGNFLICDDNDENDKELFLCKLTQDHRHICLDGGEHAKHPPLQLTQILSVQILTTGEETQGPTIPKGITLKYKDQSLIRQIKFEVSESSNKKQSVAWIVAMQKAIKMMYEARGESGK